MAGTGRSEGVAALRRRLEMLERGTRPAAAVLPFGIAAIDRGAAAAAGWRWALCTRFAGAGR